MMRNITLLMHGWEYTRLPASDQKNEKMNFQKVQLPHVWNIDEPKECGCVLYQRCISLKKCKDKEYFLAFDAVGGTADVYLNGKQLGCHKGSYSRFCYRATTVLKNGNNLLQIYADNTRDGKTNPITGDFTYFGGIYRDVTLIETEKTYFDPTYYGTSGVVIDPKCDGTIKLTASVINPMHADIHYRIIDAHGLVVVDQTICAMKKITEVKLIHPHLWNGRKDPYSYTCSAELISNGDVIDSVSMKFGFRSVSISGKNGFSLNGEHLRLNGVAKHQDFAGYGCGTGKEQIDRDFELIDEIGANAIRFAHYQHPQYAYDKADEMGFVAWAEIPMLGMQDGNKELMENAKEQLRELILQNQHHPSICFWGLQNEIGMRGETLETYANMEELEQLAKQLDSNRLTACAEVFCVANSSELNFIHDAVGYNLYYGWYTGNFPDYQVFAEKFHAQNPDVPLAITEYGADANLQYHSSSPQRQDYTEEYQALFHESVYQCIEKIPYLWGTFVWNMFDFSSSVRDEGGIPARNMKGLVTYDRQIKKDSFYFYKASWSDEPFVHLCGSRYQKRHEKTTTVKVYSNEPIVTLYVNGNAFKTIHGHRIFVFENIPLQKDTVISASSSDSDSYDEMTLQYVVKEEKSYQYPRKHQGNVANWFAENVGKNQISQDGYYSVNDRIMDLLNNEKTIKVLEEYMPDVIHDERTKIYGGMTLLRVIDRSHTVLSRQQIKTLNDTLNKIQKS
jgi:beta-galactosidase